MCIDKTTFGEAIFARCINLKNNWTKLWYIAIIHWRKTLPFLFLFEYYLC